MAKLLDFQKIRNDWYRFQFRTYDSDEFRAVLAELKKIDLAERNWLEDEKRWEVLITPNNERALVDIFQNGKSCIDIVKQQLKLF